MLTKEDYIKFEIAKIEIGELKDDDVDNPNNIVDISPMFDPRFGLFVADAILESHILDIFPNNNNIKITFRTKESESLRIIGDIVNSIITIFHVEDEQIDDKGAMVYFKVSNVITDIEIKHNEISLHFNANINKIEALKRIINNTKKKTVDANQYIMDHPQGFPYIVGWMAENPEEESVVSPRIIHAYDREEAKRLFFKEEEKYIIQDFYESVFVENAAELLYCGELIIDNISAEFTTNIKKMSKKEFIQYVKNEYTPDTIYKIIGKDNFNNILYDEMKEDIYADLGGDIADMLKYNTLEVWL